MKKKLMLIFSCLLLSAGFVMAQKQISGSVYDEFGDPVVSASVIVKGTTIGVPTDSEGKFTITLPENRKILIFNLIGMQSVEKEAKDGMRVILFGDEELLDEVFVVAYGTAKKAAFTGSAGVVRSDVISKKQTANVMNALTGNVAGVQVTSTDGRPGASPTIRIRGVGSMSASNKPLYVVDGMPYDGDISAISSQDVESMTVLKDAASNALYGARGANGVVMITTKRGEGTGKDAVINVDMKWGHNANSMKEYDVIKDPSLYYSTAYLSFYNGQALSGASPEVAHANANKSLFAKSGGGPVYKVFTVPDDEYLIGMGGIFNPNARLGYSDGTYYYTPDNWRKESIKSGSLRQEYNLSISGKSEKMSYYLSGSYLEDGGLIENSSYERYSTRTRVDYQAKDWLKVGGNIGFTYSNSKIPTGAGDGSSSANAFYVSRIIAPIYPIYVRDVEGNVMRDTNNYPIYDFGNTTLFSRPFMNLANPAGVAALNKEDYKADIFSGKWFAEFSLYEGLKATLNLGYDVSNERGRRLYNPYYGQFASVGGIIDVESNKNRSLTTQAIATYNKTFGAHNFDLLAAYESYERKIQYLYGSKSNVYNPGVIEINNAISKTKASSATDNYVIRSFLSRVQYDYDNEFFASVSFRRDGSSRFHKDNRWGNFWSAGGAWVLTEKMITEIDWLDLFKVKASYGMQGNDALLYTTGYANYYPYQNQFKITEGLGGHALEPTYYGNKDLTWEVSHSLNVGLEFDLFKGKLSGELEYYSRKTSDMLYYRPYAPSQGFDVFPMNFGSMRNQGFELGLTSNLVKTKNIGLSIYANITSLSNKILKLHPDLGGVSIDGSRIYREGKSMYVRYQPSYAGVEQETGKSLWYMNIKDDDDKVIGRETTSEYEKATYYESGSMLAKAYGGFGFNVECKGIDFSAAFAYQFGGKTYDTTYATLMHGGSSGGYNWHKDILKAWASDNPNTNVPALNNLQTRTNAMSDRFMVSSDYLSLQNISLGYTLPKSFTTKMRIASLRIYGVADNVFLISARKGMDPRQSYTSTGSDRYSPIRSISGGVSVSF